MPSSSDGSSRNRGIERLGPNRYRIRVQSRDLRTGAKTSRKRVVEGTLAEARQLRDQLAVEVRRRAERRVRPTLADYAGSWLRSRASSLKPSVAAKYATSLDLHILPALGPMRVDSLMSTDVVRYVSERCQVASGHTVLNELRLLRTIANDSVADGTAPRDWADRVRPPPVRKWTEEWPNLLGAQDLHALIAAVPVKWRRLVQLVAFTGLRWGEVSALRWCDIDVAQRLIRIRRSNWKGRIVTPKTEGSRRTVPLPPGIFDLAVVAAADGRDEDLVFPVRGGEPHRGSPLRRILDDACKTAGLPRVTPHGLRRTFNNLVRQVADELVVRSITGHVTQEMTGHYSLIGAAEKHRAQGRVMALLEPPPDGVGTEHLASDDDGSDAK